MDSYRGKFVRRVGRSSFRRGPFLSYFANVRRLIAVRFPKSRLSPPALSTPYVFVVDVRGKCGRPCVTPACQTHAVTSPWERIAPRFGGRDRKNSDHGSAAVNKTIASSPSPCPPRRHISSRSLHPSTRGLSILRRRGLTARRVADRTF